MFSESKRIVNRDPQFNLPLGEEGSSDTLAGVEGGDRPLFIQFCANDPEVLLHAAQLVEHRCDAVDINFGCPQGIAKKGHYGSFLMEEWDLISKLISTLHENLKVPVTAKFRIFPDVAKTVAYAQMMEASGAQILTCHGRTRDMKGQFTGLADWEQIKAVKAAVSVPVFANGNILYRDDVDRCLEETGVDAVMSAEGNLSNPAIFMPSGHEHAFSSSILLARRYLDFVDSVKTITSGSALKAHMFRLLKPILDEHEDLRHMVGRTGLKPEQRTAAYREALTLIEERVGNPPQSLSAPPLKDDGLRDLPIWAAQPYIRPTPFSAKVADPNATPSASAGPSRVASPTPTKRILSAPCDGTKVSGLPCDGTSAMRCPTAACIIHCRTKRAVEKGMDPVEALKAAEKGGLVGYGCEPHETKVAAKKQARKERNQARMLHKKHRKRVRSDSPSAPADPDAKRIATAA